MLWDGCLIQIEGPLKRGVDPGSLVVVEGGIAESSCSGVLLGDGSVLMSGHSLKPFLSALPDGELNAVPGCRLTVSTELFIDTGGPEKVSYIAEFMGLVQVNRTLHVASKITSILESEKINPPGFASVGVLRIRNPENIVWPPAGLHQTVISESVKSIVPKRGDPLVIVSSPFGMISPNMFRNSVSTGTVSNVFYEDGANHPALLLSDAPFHIGAEGGGVSDAYGRLIGIVAPPLQRGHSKPSLEFMSILPIDECWGSLLEKGMVYGSRPTLIRQFQQDHKVEIRVSQISFNRTSRVYKSKNMHPGTIIRFSRQSVDRGQKSLACIRVGKSWASGILLNSEGFVLTCAHLFGPFVTGASNRKLKAGYDVWVKLDGRKFGVWEKAKLIYACTQSIDMALVQLVSEQSTISLKETFPVTLANCSQITPGQQCVVIGHALFEPSLDFNPSVSKGVISKITYYNGEQAIIQSTANVLRGDSGGMLVDSVGNLLGLITSNVSSFDGNIIPTINFSVPCNIIAPLMDPNTAVDYIKKLDQYDEMLQRLWNLEDVESQATINSRSKL